MSATAYTCRPDGSEVNDRSTPELDSGRCRRAIDLQVEDAHGFVIEATLMPPTE
jgi:hypothetical protein